jgi:acyl carrier protein
MSVVAEGVMEIIAIRAKREPAQLNGSDWLNELSIESLEVVEMIFELEDRFGIEIPLNANNAGMEFKTVGPGTGGPEARKSPALTPPETRSLGSPAAKSLKSGGPFPRPAETHSRRTAWLAGLELTAKSL